MPEIDALLRVAQAETCEPFPPSIDKSQLVEKLQQALRDELQKVLRQELPLAL